ncbi:MAG TPA: hypothetical protein GX004_03330 [Firmicutes bacterium]|nr:hypothetical protein [Bacillota bacterium]
MRQRGRFSLSHNRCHEPSSEELLLRASAPDISLCRVAPSAVISGSRLRGPLVIGELLYSATARTVPFAAL